VLPAFFLILGLSYIYVTYGEVTWVSGVFYGLSAAVIGIVAAALIRIGSKALRNRVMYAIAAAAFLAIFVFHVPFPLIVIAAGLIGLVAGQRWPGTFGIVRGGDSGEKTAISDEGSAGEHTKVSFRRSAKVLVVGMAVWFIPLMGVALWRGRGDVLTQEAWFFSKAAVVTFGGPTRSWRTSIRLPSRSSGGCCPRRWWPGLAWRRARPGH
jgi:chromate transporter